MLILRNIIFNFLFFSVSIFWSVFLLWILILPQKWVFKILRNTYFLSMYWLEKYILGLDYKIEGIENLPTSGGYILACKHQSAYETLKIPLLIAEPGIIMKRELVWIPIWGWYPLAMGSVAIDRGSAKVALKSILKGADRVVNTEKRPLVVFPEGTRAAVGSPPDYKSGIARIYKATNVPVIPVALNSGIFWGKYKFWKKPGTVTFKIMPPIAPGLKTNDFMSKLEDTIESESNKLATSEHQS